MKLIKNFGKFGALFAMLFFVMCDNNLMQQSALFPVH
jgi:hypothetical protein